MAPNLPRYSNAGQAAAGAEEPAGRDRLQGRRSERWTGASPLFDIERPLFADVGACDADASCTRAARRRRAPSRHRGQLRLARRRRGSLRRRRAWLRARREGSQTPASTALRPTNVPARTLEAAGRLRRRRAARPGAAGGAGARERPHGAARQQRAHPGLDAPRPGRALRAAAPAARRWTWRAGVDNLVDRRAWKEVAVPVRPRLPVPAARRAPARLSLQADL